MTIKTKDEDQFKKINEALEKWRQGDCVLSEQWFVHRFDPSFPLTPESIQGAGQGIDLIESRTHGFSVITQTCDIVRRCQEGRIFVEVSPLVEVEATKLKEIKRGRRPKYAYIPGVSQQCFVADLDRVMTIEKPVVTQWSRVIGCNTDEESRALTEALARKRLRFAFPNDFTRFAETLISRLEEKHGKHSDEGEALRALREIRIKASPPSWNESQMQLMFWFIRAETELNFEGKTWDTYLKAWLNLVPKSGRFTEVDGDVVTLEDITAKDYVESDPLDLDHLSTGTGLQRP